MWAGRKFVNEYCVVENYVLNMGIKFPFCTKFVKHQLKSFFTKHTLYQMYF